jgi:hypothetical protein
MTLIDRRSFLKSGAGLVAMAGPLAARAQDPPKVRGVIWLWMDGGMSPSLTWDPKDNGKAKAIETTVPEIQVSEHMKVSALQMKTLSIIRSVSHGMMDHDLASWAMHTAPHSAFQTDLPLIGTILANELGKKETPLPPHLVVDGPSFPEAPVFGERVLPFRIESLRDPIPNLRRSVDLTRDRERAGLLLEQNKEWGGLRRQREVARVENGVGVSERVMNTPLIRAFHYLEEPDELRAAAGEGFGEGCLMARRLILADCAFVEVGLRGWYTRPTVAMASILDKGLGTLVQDLVAKNLLRETLVVCATAFGRSANMSQAPAPRGFSVVLAGGTLAGGRVYGDTGAGGVNCKAPVSIQDLFSTIYKACGLSSDKEYERDSRKFKYVAGGKPIDDLF